MSHPFWDFLILFAFIWILLYSLEPTFIQGEAMVVSKVLCTWYAFVIAILIVVVLMVAYLIQKEMAKKNLNKLGNELLSNLGLANKDQVVLEIVQEQPGKSPMVDTMRNIMADLKTSPSSRGSKAKSPKAGK